MIINEIKERWMRLFELISMREDGEITEDEYRERVKTITGKHLPLITGAVMTNRLRKQARAGLQWEEVQELMREMESGEMTEEECYFHINVIESGPISGMYWGRRSEKVNVVELENQILAGDYTKEMFEEGLNYYERDVAHQSGLREVEADEDLLAELESL